MIALVIEASTYVGSVALVDGARVLAERTVAMRGREHEALMPAVAEVLAEAGIAAAALDRVVCGAGPGAFTSLRIAGGIAKGIALAVNCPLVPVSSLGLLVAARPLDAGRYLAAVDAMRGEHYAQPWEVAADGRISSAGPVALVRSDALADAGASIGAVVIGPGQPGGRAVDPHAHGAARLTNLLDAGEAADLASWEPAYGRLAEAQVKWEAAHGRPLTLA
ncbi:MAG: peptidase family protein [Gemmatimonadetes bacterium]|nr:peptidase family protein [Gemmatimonadota bacterium]